MLPNQNRERNEMSDAKAKFEEITKEFEARVKDSIQEAMSSIHSDMIPYLNEDTKNNAIYRAHDIVTAIINGNASVEEDCITCRGWKLRLTSCDYDRVVDKLASIAGDKAKDLKIERLERQLLESYRS